jgi:hypothetical protein
MTNVKPTKDGFRVALDSLKHDAGVWAGASGELGVARGNAAGLGIDPGAFTAFQDIHSRYEQLRQFFVDRSSEGAAAFDSVGDNLLLARRTYMRADEAAQHEIYKVW